MGAAFLVNTTTTSDQFAPSLAALTNGGFVIAWQDGSNSGGDPDQGAIRAQVFNDIGGISGVEILINTTTAGDQSVPVAVGLADGRFVVAWVDESATGGDTDGTAIRAQILNADGSKSGGELLVNTTTADFQVLPSVTALLDGSFVVTWTDFSQTGGDTSLTAVRAQLFSADGTKSGDEFLVNATTSGNQSQPTVTALADGRIMFAFSDPGDIRGQIFDPRTEAVTLFGSGFDDSLVGTYLGDTIEGRSGDDELFGENGQDTLRGEAGNDELNGGLGNDLIDGGDGDDFLWGESGSDKLIGGAGGDILVGGAGADDMAGGAGNDTYSIDNALDVVTESTNGGTDTIQTSSFGIDLADYANVENVFLAGTGDFNLTGSSAVNFLLGNEGDNIITGKGGADSLMGGDGADIFVFTAFANSKVKAAGRDTIFDFDSSELDKIDLSAIDAKKGGADQAFTFIGTAKFHHKKGELHYKIKGGDALVEGDINGDGKPDFAILLKDVASLAATDFVL
jgi:Ca2+-binding RTX toxin-like protein